MKISRQLIRGVCGNVPAILIEPANPKGAAVIAHGYGSSKEDMAGFAFRIAENGMAACVIDLRGHGENGMALDPGVRDDMECGVGFCRRFGKVAAIGHSLGGRLALISSADFKIGISPALKKTFFEETNSVLRAISGYRIKESAPGVIFEILKMLPVWTPGGGDRALIIYGSRDNPELIEACRAAGADGALIVEINKALHYDIYGAEETINIVEAQLDKWFPG
jgi:hypothetical protein